MIISGHHLKCLKLVKSCMYLQCYYGLIIGVTLTVLTILCCLIDQREMVTTGTGYLNRNNYVNRERGDRPP